jgi:flagellar protein FlgJ
MTSAITDFTQYTTLRAGAENRDPAVLREVAGQFEALFLQTMLKTMRDASLAEPIFGNSDQSEMYQDMMDQQLAVEMASGKGIGLADMLVRQLGGESAAPGGTLTGTPPGVSPHLSARGVRAASASDSAGSGDHASLGSVRPSQTSPPDVPGRHVGEANSEDLAVNASTTQADKPFWSDAAEFAKDVWPHVKRVAKVLNVSPVGVLAQTALETGWGKHVMPDGDGQNSFNLFGIKASRGWDGDAVNKPTLEFEAGVATRQTERFRTYNDVAATFNDYENLLANNPRYETVANHRADLKGFAEALQASGYATDPQYAEKITRVAESPMMQKVLSALKSDDSLPITKRLQTDRQQSGG